MARVLVVEDEPNIAAIINYKLRREGHLVTHAASGAEGRRLAGPWDLVLLDTSLPGEDAMALLRELCALWPVAVMAESRDETTPLLAPGLGAAAVVRKPFKPTLLARLVVEITAAAKGDASHSVAAPASGLISPMVTPEVVR